MEEGGVDEERWWRMVVEGGNGWMMEGMGDSGSNDRFRYMLGKARRGGRGADVSN